MNFSFDQTFQKMFDKIYENQQSLSTQFEKHSQQGKLDYVSFVDVMESYDLGLSKSQLMELMKFLDKDNDGTIDYKEFIGRLEVDYTKFTQEKKSEEEEWILKNLRDIGKAIKLKGLDIEQAFGKFDSRKRGYLSYHDWTKAVKNLGFDFNHDERKKIAEFIDTDKSESIEISEFKNAFQVSINGVDTNKWKEQIVEQVRLALHKNKTHLQVAFRMMDTDGNGTLDRKEFEQGLRAMKIQLSPHQINLLFDIIDVDKSGTIEFHEFDSAFRVVDVESSDQENVEDKMNQAHLPQNRQK